MLTKLASEASKEDSAIFNYKMWEKAKLEHLACPKVEEAQTHLRPPTFESAGAQAPAVPPSPMPL